MRLLRPITAFAILAAPLAAQEPNGASLTIRFVDGTSRFRMGEVIPIELSFVASTPATYDMTTRSYDRSGRLNIEQFHVTPPGRDPLQKYYSSGAFMGGGLGSTRELSLEPQTMREDLNEWVALDKTGHYSLYITSGRVGRRGATKQEPVELQSNSLEFDIVPADPAWRHQTVSSAMATLTMESSTPDQKSAALRVLRFLDTSDSVKAIVRLFGTNPDQLGWDAIGGLAGSRNQKLVVSELERRMAAPDIAVSSNYLYILGKLKFQLDHEVPPYPDKDAEAQKIWAQKRESEFKEQGDLQDALYDKVAALVPSKIGRARAETLLTVLERPAREPGELKPLPGISGSEVAVAFLALTPDEQWQLLLSFWDRLKVPAMLTPLKDVASQPNINHQMLRDVALRRLYDLDPAEAAPVFLQEIKHPHLDNDMSTVKGETLGLLPNQTLPQFDDILSTRLAQPESRTMGLDAQLVGRYATKSVLPSVKAVYESAPGGWDCVTEDGFVLYFLRVDPDYGVKHLASAPSVCMSNSLPAAIKMNRWNDVEPSVIAWLNRSDLNRARQAAETLAHYGSPRGEKAVWDRLRRFRAQWSERASELSYRPGLKDDANEASGFQFGLVEALGRAQAWLLSDDQVTDLDSLALGQECENVKSWHWTSPVQVNVSFYNEQFTATVNQYSPRDVASLGKKLAQYPDGTHFVLNLAGPAQQVASVLDLITAIAAQHRFQIDAPFPTP